MTKDAWVEKAEEGKEVQLWEEQEQGEKAAGEDLQVQCSSQG